MRPTMEQRSGNKSETNPLTRDCWASLTIVSPIPIVTFSLIINRYILAVCLNPGNKALSFHRFFKVEPINNTRGLILSGMHLILASGGKNSFMFMQENLYPKMGSWCVSPKTPRLVVGVFARFLGGGRMPQSHNHFYGN